MTSTEIKSEINKTIELLPEEGLLQILNLVKQLQEKHAEEIKRDKNFEKIIKENSKLLKRLAGS